MPFTRCVELVVAREAPRMELAARRASRLLGRSADLIGHRGRILGQHITALCDSDTMVPLTQTVAEASWIAPSAELESHVVPVRARLRSSRVRRPRPASSRPRRPIFAAPDRRGPIAGARKLADLRPIRKLEPPRRRCPPTLARLASATVTLRCEAPAAGYSGLAQSNRRTNIAGSGPLPAHLTRKLVASGDGVRVSRAASAARRASTIP